MASSSAWRAASSCAPGASPRPALATAAGPGEAPDRRPRHRLPPPRQVHPDAAGRRRFRAAASRHVRAHGARPAAPQPADAARASGAGDRRRLAAGLRRSAPLRLGRPRADTAGGRAQAAGGPGPRTTGRRFLPCPSLGLADRQAHADQGRAARPEGGRRPRQHLRLRGAVPRQAQPAALGPHHSGHPRRPAGARDQGNADTRRSPPAAPRCATTCSPMANSAISSTPGRSTAAKAKPCERCPGRPACPGIRRITQSARSTFYCPRTQR